MAAEIVREKLGRLDAALNALSVVLGQRADWPAVVACHDHGQLSEAATSAAARRLAVAGFKQLEFLDEQDERRVVRFVGAVAVAPAALRTAEAVNEQKQALQSAIARFRKLTSRRERDSHRVRDLLIRFGYARLNLIQAYRKIPILERTPDRIGFSWILGSNRVCVLDREAAMRRLPGDLERSPADVRRIRREVFDTRLGDLRQVEPVAPHVKANVSWYEGDERHGLSLHAPLPILYSYSSRNRAPEIVGHDRPEPDPATAMPRQRRSDAHLRRINGTIDVFRAG